VKPYLVLLPGMLCDEAYYASQLTDLRKVATISIASYPRIDSISAMADVVLRDAPDSFAVAGHSMGGRVAQEVIARVPHRITGIGLFGTDYCGFRDNEERMREESRRLEWLALVDSKGFRHFAEQWAPLLVAPGRHHDGALLASIAAMAERLGRAGLDAHCRAGLSRGDYTDLLPTIAVPALVVTGSEDTLRPPALHRDIARRIPNARLAIIEGAGHMSSMEDPVAVTAHMVSWLNGLEP
jgi:pimeloyl-ACP methyl ester carboxylesterase